MIRPGFRPILAAVRTHADAALASYTVRPGDSLSEIAAGHCGNGNDWTGIYEASHLTGNANIIEIGQQLKLDCAYVPAELSKATSTWGSTPVTSANVVSAVQSTSSASSTSSEGSTGDRDTCGDRDDPACPQQQQQQAPAAQPQSGGGGYGGSVSGHSSFEDCVIARESGGNAQVMNSTGHYGLYQFDFGTWVSGGGNPADFGHASPAEQQGVFNAVYAARGTNPWAPYDGC